MCLCVARACRHHLSSVHPYRVGVQSEPGCSSPFYLPTYNTGHVRPIPRLACLFSFFLSLDWLGLHKKNRKRSHAGGDHGDANSRKLSARGPPAAARALVIAGSTYFSGRLLLLRLLLSRVEVRLFTDDLVRGRSLIPPPRPKPACSLVSSLSKPAYPHPHR